jgi:hypothetical protein
MKRLFYLVSLVATVCFFNSCAEEDPAQGISVNGTFTDKATIEGYVYLNTNISSSEAIKYAPAGTLLSFSIAYADLGVLGSPGNYLKTTTVDANGHYSVELPAKADGTSVTVKISGAQILKEITTDDGKSKDQVFEITQTVQDVEKGFTYQKKLEYREGSVLQVSETWEEGIYRVKLEYSDGIKKSPLPRDTEVKVTVSQNEFVPARTNDLVFIKKVGSNGLLEIVLPAPTLLNGGLTFSWESVFVAEAHTKYELDNEGNKVSIFDDYVFSIAPQQQPVIYAGETVEGGTVEANRGRQLTFN